MLINKGNKQNTYVGIYIAETSVIVINIDINQFNSDC